MMQEAGLLNYGNPMIRDIDEIIFWHILDLNAKSVDLCCVGYKRQSLIDSLERLNIKVNAYDYRLDLDYIQKDVIFDDVKLDSDVIVHFAVEKTYPIGRVHKGTFILLHDTVDSKYCCNYIDKNVVQQIVEQNQIELISAEILNKSRRTYTLVIGKSCN